MVVLASYYEAAAQALRDVLQSIKNRPIIGPKSS